MILLAYRHGLRASELCDLQWQQIELNAGRLHVRRSKKGTPSVHPMQGDEIRALRRSSLALIRRLAVSIKANAAFTAIWEMSPAGFLLICKIS
jgi:integrase